jgi:hypothetical protein
MSQVSSTGGSRAFLISLPELVAIGGRNINAGADPEGDKEDDESVFADRQHGNQQDKTGHYNSPAQQPEPHLYPDLDEEFREAVKELAGLDLNENGNGEDIMKIRTKRINYVPVAGDPIDVPTSMHCVLAMLEPGTQVSTITSKLSKNQQDRSRVWMGHLILPILASQ